jgi:hypothetical protein
MEMARIIVEEVTPQKKYPLTGTSWSGQAPIGIKLRTHKKST